MWQWKKITLQCWLFLLIHFFLNYVSIWYYAKIAYISLRSVWSFNDCLEIHLWLILFGLYSLFLLHCLICYYSNLFLLCFIVLVLFYYLSSIYFTYIFLTNKQNPLNSLYYNGCSFGVQTNRSNKNKIIKFIKLTLGERIIFTI